MLKEFAKQSAVQIAGVAIAYTALLSVGYVAHKIEQRNARKKNQASENTN